MTCSSPSCPSDVFARGLCAMHYQRFRRTGTMPLVKGSGRPLEYPPGSPKLVVRLPPEVHRVVMERGGARYVREVMEGAVRGKV